MPNHWQIFILDWRSHPKVSLVDAVLAQSQGPALLAVNDTIFTDSNWEALATISASDKVTDETLVFCTCSDFLLTQNP